MPDLSEFMRDGRRRLRVDELLDELPPDLAEKLRAALDNPSIRSTKISQVVNGWGYSLADNAVRKWMQRQAQGDG